MCVQPLVDHSVSRSDLGMFHNLDLQCITHNEHSLGHVIPDARRHRQIHNIVQVGQGSVLL